MTALNTSASPPIESANRRRARVAWLLGAAALSACAASTDDGASFAGQSGSGGTAAGSAGALGSAGAAGAAGGVGGASGASGASGVGATGGMAGVGGVGVGAVGGIAGTGAGTAGTGGADGSAGTAGVGGAPPTCTGKRGVSGTATRTAMGLQYIVHGPPGLDGNTAVPLLFIAHGFTMNGALMQSMTNYDAVADREKFVVVYPNGHGAAPWNVGDGTCAPG